MSATPILEGDEDVVARVSTENRDPSNAVNPRDLAIQMIEDARIRDFEATERVKVPVIPDIDPDADPDEAEAELERARLQAIADGKAAAPARTESEDQLARQLDDGRTVIEDPSNVMVKRKVNGVEELVPLADVLREHQVGEAADYRLRKATELFREAEEARNRALAAPAAPAAPAEPETPTEDVQAIAKGITSAFFSGDEEAAQELLVKALTERPSSQTPVAATPPIDVLAEQVEQQLEVNRAKATFAADYSRLREDPDLVNMVNRRINAKTQAGVPMSQAILDSGRELYEKFGWSTPSTERPRTPATTTRAEKLVAKEALDPLPFRATAAATATDENTPESASSVIAQIKAARGQ